MIEAETLEELRKTFGIPTDDVIVIVHVKRKDIEKVCGALELVGIMNQAYTLTERKTQ